MRVDRFGDISIPESELCYSCARAVSEEYMCPLIEALRTKSVKLSPRMEEIEDCACYIQKNLIGLLDCKD